MVTFIDEAREFRAQGASRRQLVGYLQLHGVDDDRAFRLADRLDMELGLSETPLPAPPASADTADTASPAAPTESAEPGVAEPEAVIDLAASPALAPEAVTPTLDLTDQVRSSGIPPARDANSALSQVQSLVDRGASPYAIKAFLINSGVKVPEAHHVAKTTVPTIQVKPAVSTLATPPRRRDFSQLWALISIMTGLAVATAGFLAASDGEILGSRLPVLLLVLGAVVASLGLLSLYSAA